MQAFKKITAWFSRFRKQPASAPVDLDAHLPDEVKQELAGLAQHLKGEYVSVRALYKDEVASDTPEIGDKPIKPADGSGQ